MRKKLSFRYRMLEVLMRLTGMKLLCNCSPHFVRQVAFILQKIQSSNPPKKIVKKYKIIKMHYGNAVCYRISPSCRKEKQVIMFIHGGGWFMQINPFQWRVVEKIIDRTGYTVYVPIYQLAPVHHCEEALEFIQDCYERIEKTEHTDPILLGDSAGAQITLSILHRLKRQKINQPQKAILVSPPTTFYLTPALQKKMKALEKKDVMLTTKLFPTAYQMWGGGLAITDDRISPYYGDFSGICPIDIFTGTREIIYPQALELEKKIREAEGTVSLYEGKGMMHTWTHLPMAPECKQGLDMLITVIQQAK